MRLEKRRVLSADFSFVGGGLLLDGFDGPDGDSLAIVQDADTYRFTTEDGWSTDGPTPDGVTVEGDTLSVDRGVIDSLSRGLTVADNDNTPLDVTLGQADFSGLAGPVTLLAPASVGQQALTTFTAPSAGLQMASAASGLTLTSLSVAGDLNLLAFGSITDGPDTQVFVSGDATFTTLDDGTGNAGIHLTDSPGDRLEVLGTVWFDGAQRADESDRSSPALERWDIRVGFDGDGGLGGWTEFGNVIAEGDRVAIREAAPTTIEHVDANDLHLVSAGSIDTTADASILVANDAQITSNGARYRSDFDNSFVVDRADYDLWSANYGETPGATRVLGDANGDGDINAADYTVWRDELNAADPGGGIDITIAGTFRVGGVATLVAEPDLDPIAEDLVPAEDRFDITVGRDVVATFGSLDVRGRDVVISEDADGASPTTLLTGVDARSLALVSDGVIADTADAVIAVAADASFLSTGGITLANDDAAGTLNQVAIGGVATFAIEGSGGGITVGAVGSGGARAEAVFTAGKVRFASTDESGSVQVSLHEDDAMTIASWSGGSILGTDGTPSNLVGNNASDLDLYAAGSITDDPGMNLTASGATIVAEGSVTLADNATDQINVSFVTSVVAGATGTGGIDLGVLPSGDKSPGRFDTGLIRFATPDSARINDASGTLIEGWVGGPLPTLGAATPTTNAAQTLTLVTDGGILDEAGATIDIAGDATFIAPFGIVLADEGSENRLSVGGATTVLVPVSDPAQPTSSVLLGIDTSNFGVPADAAFNTAELRINAVGQDVLVAEDSGTVITAWAGADLPDSAAPTANQSQTLTLISAGSINDEAGVVLEVADAATLSAVGEIVLADQDSSTNRLSIGGLGQFSVTPDGGTIALGVDPTSGAPVESEALIGRMALIAAGGQVEVALDADATFDRESFAEILAVTATGDILDADPTATSTVKVFVSGDARFEAGRNILLADSATPDHALQVIDNARFTVAPGGAIDVGIRPSSSRLAGDLLMEAASTTEFGTLTYVATDGAVRIAQDNAAVLIGSNVAGDASLLSNVSITDAPGTTVDVTGDAWFGSLDDAFISTPITLGDNPTDRLTFGSLSLLGGVTTITEHTFVGDATAGTELRDVNADQLTLDSAGPITDTANAAIQVSSDATLSAIGEIVLADSTRASNLLSVRGHGQFTVTPGGGTIDLGVDPTTGLPADSTARLDTMSFTAADGTVRVALDDDAEFDRQTIAGTLNVRSSGSILDATPTDEAVSVTVTGDATLLASGDIRLSDADDILNSLDIDGLGSFAVGSGRVLDLGVVAATGEPADSITTIERLTFAAPDGDVRIALDNAITLSGVIEAATLSLNSVDDLTDEAGTTIRVTGATDLTAQTPAGERRRIILGDNAADVTTFGSLDVTGSEIDIQEDAPAGDLTPGTLLTGVEAESLIIESVGPITDSASAVVLVDAFAVMTSDAGITLADDNTPGTTNRVEIGGNANFTSTAGDSINVGVQADGAPAEAVFNAGTVTFSTTGGTVRLAEDGGLQLAGSSNALNVRIRSEGGITDTADTILTVTNNALFDAATGVTLADDNAAGTSNRLTVANNASFVAAADQPIDVGVQPASGAPAEAAFQAGTLTFSTSGGTVRLAEDDGLELTGESLAATLRLRSEGAITDTPDARLLVTATALFDAEAGITLADDSADGTTNSLAISNNARFVVAADQDIDLGVEADGAPAEANFQAGTLSFAATGGSVRVAEDDGLELANDSNAATVRLRSEGQITDTADAVLTVTNTLLADAEAGITLADSGANNRLEVTSNARFVAASGQNIDLGVQADGSPALANFQTGDLSFSAAGGTVRIAEDDGLTLTDASDAGIVSLRSAGAIADTLNARLRATNSAEFLAQTTITLADDDAAETTNSLVLDFGVRFVSLSGGDLRVGVTDVGEDAAATARFGGLNFVSGDGTPGGVDGTVTIHEDSIPGETNGSPVPIEGVFLILESTAGDLVLGSDSSIADEFTASVKVANNAILVSGTDTTLAADNLEPTTNRFIVGGNASFNAGAGRKIDVGVQANGLPAEAVFNSGTLTFSAPGGTVRIAEDADVVLAGANATDQLEINSSSRITDINAASENGPAIADTRVGQSAIFVAGEGLSNVELGAGPAGFWMENAAAFSRDQFLQVTARDVSIQADSGVNVRAADQQGEGATSLSRGSLVRGTYHLTAEGHITQVHRPSERTTFSADQIALRASGAVFFDSLSVSSADPDAPNLQIKAGDAILLAAGLDGSDSDGLYAREAIPDERTDRFAPIVVGADSAEGQRGGQPQRVDAEGVARGDSDNLLQDVVTDVLAEPDGREFARLNESSEPTILGEPNNDVADDYSIVVHVDGSAIVGDVRDATGNFDEANEEAARGIVVETTGNAFLDTTGELTFSGYNRFAVADGSAGEEATVVELAGGVLTAIAGTSLRIDTTEGDKAAGETVGVARTTKLTSATGTVTDIGPADSTVTDTENGPRVVVDQPVSNTASAATTGIVRAEDDFEQRITVALGSRGEDNLLVEVEWADVADIREDSPLQPLAVTVDARTDFDPTLPGVSPRADLIQTPRQGIESAGPEEGLSYERLGNAGSDFRVVTIRHNYSEEFIPANRTDINQNNNRLPTTVRVYNDPAINLFQLNGNETLAEAQDLNSATFSLAPQVITQSAGFFRLSTPDRPAEYVTPELVAIRSDAIPTAQRALGDEDRSAVVSSAESVVYGRVDDRTGRENEWITDIPGEEWPQSDDETEGDFLREIRERIDNGPYSEGRYQIRISTPRGEQLLEEWTKGDLNAEETQEGAQASGEMTPDAAGAVQPNAANEAADPTQPAQPNESEAVPAIAPLAPRTSSVEARPNEDATQAAFAAMAAVGAWRQRLGGRGGFTLDSDGVGFARANRRRRRPRS